MAELPYMPVYTADYLGDTALQLCSGSTRGGWMNILCYMWDAPIRGVIQGTDEKLRGLANITGEEWKLFEAEAIATRFCEFDRDCNGTVTLKNRRMIRDQRRRDQTKARVRKHREQDPGDEDGNGTVTGHIHNPESKSKELKAKEENPYPVQVSRAFLDSQYREKAVRLARAFYRERIEEYPKQYYRIKTDKDREKLITRGAVAIDLILRIDLAEEKNPFDRFKEILRFALENSFWHFQLWSLPQLREGKGERTKLENILSAMEKSRQGL